MELYVLYYKYNGSWRFVEGGGSSTPASPKVYKTKSLAEKYQRIYSKTYKERVYIANVNIKLPE